MISQPTTKFDGLLLVGHGTRDPAGLAELHQLVERVRSCFAPIEPRLPIEGCCLELAEPTIAEGLRSLVRAGSRRVRAVPLVLFAAGHAKRDIPRAGRSGTRHPGVTVDQAPHLGCHPEVARLSERRYEQAVAEYRPLPQAESMLVLVGRGSNDPEATAEMRRFCDCRSAQLKCHMQMAFIALAEPRLDDVLQRATRSRMARIVVQPHLLFAGQLLTELRAKVDRAAAQSPDKQWIVVDHLGPDASLAACIGDIVRDNLAPAGVKVRTKLPGATS